MFVWGSPWPFDRVRMGNALEQLRTENPKPKCDPNPWRLRQVHVSTASTVHNCLCAYFCWMTRHHIWTNLITKQCDITYKHKSQPYIWERYIPIVPWLFTYLWLKFGGSCHFGFNHSRTHNCNPNIRAQFSSQCLKEARLGCLACLYIYRHNPSPLVSLTTKLTN